MSPGRTRSYHTRESRSVAALLAACRIRGVDAELRQARKHLLESLALRLKQRRIRIVRRREVRVDGDDLEIAAGDQLGQRELEVVVAQPEPVHAGVDLQVTAKAHAVLRGGGLQRPAGAGRRDGRRQVVLEHAVDVAHAERAEDQNLGGDAGLPKHDRFFDVGAREDLRARLLQRERDGRRAVAVRVRLDDGDDAGRCVTVRVRTLLDEKF